MNNWWLYIKFLLNSTNHHGVQSPFVFALVTKCFYNKKNLNIYKKLQSDVSAFKNVKFLYRFSIYFEFDSIYQPEELNSYYKSALAIGRHSKDIKTYTRKIPKINNYDKNLLIYFQNRSLEHLSEIQNILEQCNTNSIVLIENIRQTSKGFEQWNTLKSNANVRVSIDTYHWGVLWFRKEQHKEHFIIRL